MLETIGTRLKQARRNRGLDVEGVAEVTKIRPERIRDLEADDYSRFPNLTYARSFLAKYAAYLEVDIREDLDNFRVNHSISLAEYPYLSSPAMRRYAPERSPVTPRAFRVPPVVVAVLVGFVLVGVPMFAYLAVGLSRLQPRPGELAGQDEVAVVSPTPATAPAAPAAPSPAVPFQAWLKDEEQVAATAPAPAPPSTSAPVPAPAAIGASSPSESPAVLATDSPAAPPPVAVAAEAPVPLTPVAVATPSAEPSGTAAATDPSSAATDAPAIATAAPETAGALGPRDVDEPALAGKDGKRLEVRALKRAYVRVVRDKRHSEPVFSGYTSPDANPIIVEGQRFWLKVSDRRAVEVREDGQVVKGKTASVVIN